MENPQQTQSRQWCPTFLGPAKFRDHVFLADVGIIISYTYIHIKRFEPLNLFKNKPKTALSSLTWETSPFPMLETTGMKQRLLCTCPSRWNSESHNQLLHQNKAADVVFVPPVFTARFRERQAERHHPEIHRKGFSTVPKMEVPAVPYFRLFRG